MANDQLKLKQIIETQAGVYGLSEEGEVWVYNGHKVGWAKLNMTKMTKRDVTKKFKAKNSALRDAYETEMPW